MHDYHSADQILKIVLEKAAENNLNKITSINIELGSIVEHGEEINPENLEFNFNLLAKNTIAQNAILNIKKIQADSWKLIDIEGE